MDQRSNKRRHSGGGKLVYNKKIRQALGSRPLPRKMVVRPSLVFTKRLSCHRDKGDLMTPFEFMFKQKDEDQKIIMMLTSDNNTCLQWMATRFLQETDSVFRSLQDYPTAVPREFDPSSPTLPWDDEPQTDEFLHLSRYVKVLFNPNYGEHKILLDVNEMLLDIDFWIRSCKNLDVNVIADMILAYYNVFDTVDLRSQTPEALQCIPTSIRPWFNVDQTDYTKDCIHCAESFAIPTDCARCWKTW